MLPSLVSVNLPAPILALPSPFFGLVMCASAAVQLVALSLPLTVWRESSADLPLLGKKPACTVVAASIRAAVSRAQQGLLTRTPEARRPLSAESFVFVSENRGSSSGPSASSSEGQRTTYACLSSPSPRLFLTSEAARSAPNPLPLNMMSLRPIPDRGTRERDVAFLSGPGPYGSFPRAERAQAWRGQGHKD